jgi:hypothetical protein
MTDSHLIDRTRKPAKILAAENDPARVIVSADGQMQHDVLLIVDAETKQRIEQGWICAYCTEPLAEAFPEECNFCRFPVREEQTRYIAKHTRGDIRLGSRIKLADEFERMREIDAFEKRTGIVLPDSVRSPSGEL